MTLRFVEPHNPLSRSTDPSTSLDAGEAVRGTERRRSQMEYIARGVWDWPGQTSRELAVTLSLDRYDVARRLADLMHCDRAEQGDSRACKISGRRCVTWWPVHKPESLEW